MEERSRLVIDEGDRWSSDHDRRYFARKAESSVSMNCNVSSLALIVPLVFGGSVLAQCREVPTAQTDRGVSQGDAHQSGTKAANNSRPTPDLKLLRRDSAFRNGYDEGYRWGANDSMANSNSYNDENGSVYNLATDGYTVQYGDVETYQKRFRLGYIDGYKAGWDFNAGRYCASCGPR